MIVPILVRQFGSGQLAVSWQVFSPSRESKTTRLRTDCPCQLLPVELKKSKPPRTLRRMAGSCLDAERTEQHDK
ncbi:MAG: hypothetical protein IPM82_07075 [Saprospiraceae bacterium]|nr:hypothetical protein [Saprospiraceae bacterium]